MRRLPLLMEDLIILLQIALVEGAKDAFLRHGGKWR